MRHPCIGMTSALHAVRRDGPRPACQAQWSRLWSGHDATVAAPHRHASSRSNARCKPHFGKGGNDPDPSPARVPEATVTTTDRKEESDEIGRETCRKRVCRYV